MKKEVLLSRIALVFFVLFVAFMSGCSDDPESTNEEEVVTTVIVTLTPAEEEGTITLTWDDADLDAVVDESEINVSANLEISKTYTAVIQLLNKSVSPEVDITEEVADEAEDHIFCFTVSGANIAITNRNTDSNGLPLGTTSTWTTTTLSTGTVNITLRHQPGVKTGVCPGAGDTDASITFPVNVGVPI